jgi:ketosteroid isomerase-like protein
VEGLVYGFRVSRMTTGEAAERWARTWERAWREHDSSAIVALYADGAHFQSHPFREAQPAAEYVEQVFAEEETATPVFHDPIIAGDRAAVEWHAQTRLRDGSSEDLAGVSLLRFNTEGLVVEQRDVWSQR